MPLVSHLLASGTSRPAPAPGTRARAPGMRLVTSRATSIVASLAMSVATPEIGTESAPEAAPEGENDPEGVPGGENVPETARESARTGTVHETSLGALLDLTSGTSLTAEMAVLERGLTALEKRRTPPELSRGTRPLTPQTGVRRCVRTWKRRKRRGLHQGGPLRRRRHGRPRTHLHSNPVRRRPGGAVAGVAAAAAVGVSVCAVGTALATNSTSPWAWIPAHGPSPR